MENQQQAAEAANIPDFAVDALDAVDVAEMNVLVGGVPSGWKWTFAGPGHPQTIAQTNRLAKERLRKDAEIDRARNNGKQWKPDVEDPAEVRARNVAFVVERLTGWSPVRIGGEIVSFSAETATAFLSDPRKGATLAQAIEFLADGQSFTRRSAKI